MNGCSGFLGRLVGHKFVANYDLLPPDMGGTKIKGYEVTEVIQALTSKKYVNSVCTRCGQMAAPAAATPLEDMK